MTTISKSSGRSALSKNQEMNLMQNRIAVFIDEPNLLATMRALAFNIDYKRLLDELNSVAISSAPSTTRQPSKIRNLTPSAC